MKKAWVLSLFVVLCWIQSGAAKSSVRNPCKGPFPSKLQKACQQLKNSSELPMHILSINDEDPFVQDVLDALKIITEWEDEDIRLEKETSQVILERLFQMGSNEAKAYALWGMAETVWVDRKTFDKYADKFSHQKSTVTSVGGERGCGIVQRSPKEILEEIRSIRDRNDKYWKAVYPALLP